jgi:hypothetical protein
MATLGCSVQGARQQLNLIERGFVSPKRVLVLRAAIREIEDWSRQSRLGEGSQRIDAVCAPSPPWPGRAHAGLSSR